MQNKILTQSLSTFRIVLISSLTIFTLYTVQAWVSPTLSAPNGNVGGPLTTATSTQIKTGSLGLLDSLSIGKSLLVNGTTTSSGKIIANGGFQLITGAASGTVLTSDTSGNARWASSTSGNVYKGFYVLNDISGCYIPNVVTSACTCPAGSTSAQIGRFVGERSATQVWVVQYACK